MLKSAECELEIGTLLFLRLSPEEAAILTWVIQTTLEGPGLDPESGFFLDSVLEKLSRCFSSGGMPSWSEIIARIRETRAPPARMNHHHHVLHHRERRG